MATTQALTLTQVSQSVADNTSKVRILWTTTQTGPSYNNYTLTGYYWVSINGGAETKYPASSTLPKGTTKTILDATITVNHNEYGNCTVKVRTSFDTCISAGVITKSATLELDQIAQRSTLSANNGTLGTAQTLTVSRRSTALTHTITYTCGTASGTICTKSTSTSISWTPPLSLASQNKTGTSVSIAFKIVTYSGSTNVGSISKTITCSIPSSVKPSCKITVTDPTGYYDEFGYYLWGQSKIKVVVTPTLAYGSPIESYTVIANGQTYRSDEIITGVIGTGSTKGVTVTVTDARGRTSSQVVQNIPVYRYVKPMLILSVGRCNADGTDNDRGEWVNVKFSATVQPINGGNGAVYTLKYKKTSDSNYTLVELNEYEERYFAEGSYIFAADPESSYDISLTVTDSLYSISQITSVSTAFVLMDWKGSGTGIAFGKKSELDNTMDIDLELHQRQDMYVSNNKKIYGVSTDGTVKNAFQAQNENGNTVIGYGNYDHRSGSTNLYGHDILFGVSNIPTPGTFRPYRRPGDTQSLIIRTSGYVTNGGKDVSFWIPLSVPIIGSPTITVSSVNGFVLRQGNNYTHGSSADTYTTPESYEASLTMFHGIHVKAVFADTTNVTNNDSIGIYWSGTITFS